MPLARMTMQDIERAAYGAEEIGEHEYRDGRCIHCTQPDEATYKKEVQQ